jgi:hypothetical protein
VSVINMRGNLSRKIWIELPYLANLRNQEIDLSHLTNNQTGEINRQGLLLIKNSYGAWSDM